ncbi:hypothetical protein M2146_001129 [Lachnospiraceae bacterium PF1-22]
MKNNTNKIKEAILQAHQFVLNFGAPLNDVYMVNATIFFTNSDGASDSTQFDVDPEEVNNLDPNELIKTITDLWTEFCEESNFDKNKIAYVALG